jgi:hypothetical protein
MAQVSAKTVGDVIAAVESRRIENVPDELVRLLRESNLHSIIEGMFYVDPSTMLTPLQVNDAEYFTLASNEEPVTGQYLVSRTGEVFFLGSESEFRLVNSRLSYFLQFMKVWHRFVSNPAPRDVTGDVDEDAVIEIGMEIKGNLERLDEAAFSSEETWWSNVFEEVELGTLGPL